MKIWAYFKINKFDFSEEYCDWLRRRTVWNLTYSQLSSDSFIWNYSLYHDQLTAFPEILTSIFFVSLLRNFCSCTDRKGSILTGNLASRIARFHLFLIVEKKSHFLSRIFILTYFTFLVECFTIYIFTSINFITHSHIYNNVKDWCQIFWQKNFKNRDRIKI